MLHLKRNELETLRILWEHGELKPADIEAQFGWPIENATLRSTLVNLVEKKHITRELRGKAFFYAARVPKATLLESVLHGLARIFAQGSTQGLVTQLVETADVKPADLKIISQAAAGRPSRKTKPRRK